MQCCAFFSKLHLQNYLTETISFLSRLLVADWEASYFDLLLYSCCAKEGSHQVWGKVFTREWWCTGTGSRSAPSLKPLYTSLYKPVLGLRKPSSYLFTIRVSATVCFTTDALHSSVKAGPDLLYAISNNFPLAAFAHLVFHTFHSGSAERCDVDSHCLPILTKNTQLELYCLSLLQTVTFVCHSNNSKRIEFSFHFTYRRKHTR